MAARKRKTILDELNQPLPSDRSVRKAYRLIKAVHKVMNRDEWDSDTTASIAGILSKYGLTFKDPNE